MNNYLSFNNNNKKKCMETRNNGIYDIERNTREYSS